MIGYGELRDLLQPAWLPARRNALAPVTGLAKFHTCTADLEAHLGLFV